MSAILILLADERLLRDMATIERIRPVGTLGVLLLATRRGLLTTAEARRHLDALVREHEFRIGIALYEAVLAGLDRTT